MGIQHIRIQKKRNIVGRLSRLTAFLLLVVFFSLSTFSLSAQVMQSGSYSIQSDSINFGGSRATSSSYAVEDTLGEIATGPSGSTSFNLYAGYQQMQSSSISITAIDNLTLSGAIGGISGGTSNGSVSFTVITDNQAGYEVLISASNTPALVLAGLDSFDDYAPSTADPDFAWSVPSNTSEFGFTPEGLDIADRFRDLAGACNQGSGDTADACWDGLSTTPEVFVNRTTSNHPSGTLTTLKFRAESGANHVQIAGTYYATTTVTALAL